MQEHAFGALRRLFAFGHLLSPVRKRLDGRRLAEVKITSPNELMRNYLASLGESSEGVNEIVVVI